MVAKVKIYLFSRFSQVQQRRARMLLSYRNNNSNNDNGAPLYALMPRASVRRDVL